MRLTLKNNSYAFNIDARRQKGNKVLYRLLFAALILLTIPAVLAADFWVKKEYKEWKQNECVKMLQDSPWARTYTVAGRAGGESMDGEIPSIKYTARLSSALPVRQATIRLSQIANKYDSLSAEQKQQLDQQYNSFLATPFTDVIVVQVDYSTNVNSQQIPLVNHWQMQTTEHLRNTTYLIGAKDVKVQLQEFQHSQQGQFLFIFPRKYEGQPLLTPQDKSLKLEFEVPSIGGMGGETAYIDFKVNKMILDGEVIY